MNRLFFLSLLALTQAAFAANITLENLTPYPKARSKMAIQWASSAREVDANNKAIIAGEALKTDTLQVISRSGKMNVTTPSNAEYFRVVVWFNQESPEFITNWVDIIPDKVYLLQEEHLVPACLMPGSGC